MNKFSFLLAGLIVLASAAISQAGKKPFPHQPHIDKALTSLRAAAKQVDLAGSNSAAHIAKASQHLTSASSELETAKKDKGSARPAAIQLIDAAQTELHASPFTGDHRTKASQNIQAAIKEVVQAGKNGQPH